MFWKTSFHVNQVEVLVSSRLGWPLELQIRSSEIGCPSVEIMAIQALDVGGVESPREEWGPQTEPWGQLKDKKNLLRQQTQTKQTKTFLSATSSMEGCGVTEVTGGAGFNWDTGW